MKALKELAERVVASMDWSVEDRLALLSGYVIGFDLRMEALEKRVYKLEDVVNEILRRSAGVGKLVSTSDRAADGEPVPSDRDAQGRTFKTSDGVSLSSGGGATVKRNA